MKITSGQLENLMIKWIIKPQLDDAQFIVVCLREAESDMT